MPKRVSGLVVKHLISLNLPFPSILKFNSQPKDLVDTKGKFQQWALAKFGENPRYESNDGEGLDHAKIFTAEVRVRGKLYGVGKGNRKQEAEKSAAEKALKKVGLI